MPVKVTYRIVKRFINSMVEEEHDPGVELKNRRTAVSVGYNLFRKNKNLRLVRVEANGKNVAVWVWIR